MPEFLKQIVTEKNIEDIESNKEYSRMQQPTQSCVQTVGPPAENW